MRTVIVLSLLVSGAPAVASSSAAPSAQPGAGKDKLICKREVPIGSLIATRKRCMTKEEWARSADEQNEAARKMIDDLRTRPSAN